MALFETRCDLTMPIKASYARAISDGVQVELSKFIMMYASGLDLAAPPIARLCRARRVGLRRGLIVYLHRACPQL